MIQCDVETMIAKSLALKDPIQCQQLKKLIRALEKNRLYQEVISLDEESYERLCDYWQYKGKKVSQEWSNRLSFIAYWKEHLIVPDYIGKKQLYLYQEIATYEEKCLIWNESHKEEIAEATIKDNKKGACLFPILKASASREYVQTLLQQANIAAYQAYTLSAHRIEYLAGYLMDDHTHLHYQWIDTSNALLTAIIEGDKQYKSFLEEQERNTLYEHLLAQSEVFLNTIRSEMTHKKDDRKEYQENIQKIENSLIQVLEKLDQFAKDQKVATETITTEIKSLLTKSSKSKNPKKEGKKYWRKQQQQAEEHLKSSIDCLEKYRKKVLQTKRETKFPQEYSKLIKTASEKELGKQEALSLERIEEMLQTKNFTPLLTMWEQVNREAYLQATLPFPIKNRSDIEKGMLLEMMTHFSAVLLDYQLEKPTIQTKLVTYLELLPQTKEREVDLALVTKIAQEMQSMVITPSSFRSNVLVKKSLKK